MTRTLFTPDNPRRRTNRAVVRRRIEQYPLASWLEEVFDENGNRAHQHATQSEDFPGITRAAFIQDLHRLAREATRRALASGEAEGWIATTSTAGYPEDEMHFAFIRAPFDECPQPRKSETGRAALHTLPQGTTAGPASATVDQLTRTTAWQAQATRLLWCHSPEGAYVGHQIGLSPDDACPFCAGATARTVITPTPPSDWNPGDPIPAGIA